MPTPIRHLLAAILLAVVFVAPVAAQPSTPEPQKIILQVPPKASKEEVLARLELVAPRGKIVRVHVEVNPQLEPLPTPPAISAMSNTTATTTTLNFDRPARNNYQTASAEDLHVTLSYSTDRPLTIAAYSTVYYNNVENPEDMFYEDFDAIVEKVNGTGTINLSLPTYRPRTPYAQRATFDAHIGSQETGYIYAESVFVASGQVFVAIAAK